MVDRFKKYIEENNLFSAEDRVLLAVSGGIDSMVMANLFISCGFNVGIAHCNFSLREEESDKDEQLVRQLALKNKLSFYTIRFNTKRYAAEHSISIQMAARDLRYSWFRKICAEHSYQYIATAHNLDDKIETFFLNLTRGTGIKGLSGMPARNADVIHPILFASRKEIEEYAKASGVEFREDATNATTHYSRNRIRHNVLPELCIINPSFDSTMEENMQRIMQAEELLQNLLGELKQKACRQEGDLYIVSIEQLKPYQPLSLFLFELLYPFGFTASTIKDIEQSLAQQSGKQFFSSTHQLVLNRGELLISPIEDEEGKEEYKIGEGVNELNYPINMVFERIPKLSLQHFETNSNIVYLDISKLSYPLILRKWKAGDSFTPFGMSGTKKLSDFFIDEKLSLIEKQQQWVLVSNNQIVWVVGRRVDNRFRVDDSTKTVLKIVYSR